MPDTLTYQPSRLHVVLLLSIFQRCWRQLLTDVLLHNHLKLELLSEAHLSAPSRPWPCFLPKISAHPGCCTCIVCVAKRTQKSPYVIAGCIWLIRSTYHSTILDLPCMLLLSNSVVMGSCTINPCRIPAHAFKSGLKGVRTTYENIKTISYQLRD